MDVTPVSLLSRLKQAPQPADWNALVELCAPAVLKWAKSKGLRDAAAADLVQDVFVVLLEEMPRFNYDPNRSFRGWLKTVTLNKWRSLMRKEQPLPLDAIDEASEVFAIVEPEPTFWETDFNRILVERAMQIVRVRFEPTTWEACRQMTIEGLSAKETATNLGLTEAAVYKAKSRVLRVLREELEGMID